jgi:hypothetical protein
MDERQRAVDRFQNGEADLFVGNIKAAGVGITLTKSSHVVFAELDWVPGNLTQAEDRCHRIGQDESVLVQHLVFEDSVDAYMVQQLIDKQDVVHRAMDAQPEELARTEELLHEAEQKGIKISDAIMERFEDARDEILNTAVEVEFAEPLPEEQVRAIHTCLRMLGGMCDGARKLDGCGFNKMDAAHGKRLAWAPSLTDREARIGQKMVRKYHRQLPADLLAVVGGE